MRSIGAVVALASLLGAAACQKQPVAAAPSPPPASSPSVSASAAPVTRDLELPKTIIGLAQVELAELKDPKVIPDWGMSVSLRAAFPQARAVGSAGLKSEKGIPLLVGVAVVETPDPKAAIDKAFASMAPRQGHPSVGLGLPRAHSVSPGPLGGMVLCGPADGGGADFPVCAWAGDGIVGLVAYVGDGDAKYVESRILKIRTEVTAAVKQAGLAP